MKRLVLGVAAVLILAAPAWAAVRTWSSANGKFSVQAELLDVAGGKARLQKTNGKVITVPVVKLSSADRRFLKGQNSQAPDATKSADSSKLPAGLAVTVKAQWESPPPPLIVNITMLGESAAKATSYGRLKLTKATTADGLDMKRIEGIGPGSDPVKGFVKIDRKDRFFAKHPKNGVLVPLKFERPKGLVKKTGRIEGSLQLITGGQQKAVVVPNLAAHLKKTIENASLKAAGFGLKLSKQNEKELAIEVKGKRENMIDMVLVDKNGKPIKTMGGTFQMGNGPINHSFMAQAGLPPDVGLRVTVVTGAKTVEVPFSVSGLDIEEVKQTNSAISFPMFKK